MVSIIHLPTVYCSHTFYGVAASSSIVNIMRSDFYGQMECDDGGCYVYESSVSGRRNHYIMGVILHTLKVLLTKFPSKLLLLAPLPSVEMNWKP